MQSERYDTLFGSDETMDLENPEGGQMEPCSSYIGRESSKEEEVICTHSELSVPRKMMEGNPFDYHVKYEGELDLLEGSEESERPASSFSSKQENMPVLDNEFENYFASWLI